MTDSGDYNIYVAVINGQHRHLVSLLPEDIVFKSGLPPEAIMGTLTDGPHTVTPEAFQQNERFIQFLAFVIAKHAADCPGLIAEAQQQPNGYVYILDKRTPTPQGAVPPEDIIGGVEIENGQMLRFHGLPTYRILTSNGFMQLDSWFKARLIEELVAVATRDRNIKPK